jgi:hypothetical protein
MRNCPVCGAENEAEARFCAECGAPLGDDDNEATMVGRVKVFPGPEEEDESERTILSNFFRSTEEAETLTVDQAEIIAARAETPPKAPAPPSTGPEADIPPVSAPPPFERPVVEVSPPLSSGRGEGSLPPAGTGGRKNNWPMIIGIILVLLLLCCCCCSFVVGGTVASDPDTMDDLMRELGVFVPHFFAWI